MPVIADAVLSSDALSALRDCFERADGRMVGLPVHNPLLSVELRGFQPWGSLTLGVLITPWCMNLILLPGAEMDPQAITQWAAQAQGQEVDHALPCGTVRFVVGDDGWGARYLMCSLFSPMDDFVSQQQAQEVADETLAAVLLRTKEVDEPVDPLPSPPVKKDLSRRDLFRGLRARAEA